MKKRYYLFILFILLIATLLMPISSYAADKGDIVLGGSFGTFRAMKGISTDDNGNVYVSDNANNQIRKYSSNGDYITSWGQYGTTGLGGTLNAPCQNIVKDGYLYVISVGFVSKFTLDGTFVSRVTGNGWTGGFALDDNYVYYTNYSSDTSGKIYRANIPANFSGALTNITILKTGYYFSIWYNSGYLYYCYNAGDVIYRMDTTTWTESVFYDPPESGIHAMLIQGDYLYYTSVNNDRVIKYKISTATIEFTIGTGNNSDGNYQFNDPLDLAVCGGYLYVNDQRNYKVKKYTTNGVYQKTWGGPSNAPGQFNNPRSVALDSTGNIYISDMANNRIQKLTSMGAINPGTYANQLSADCTKSVTIGSDGKLYTANFSWTGTAPGSMSIERMDPTSMTREKMANSSNGLADYPTTVRYYNGDAYAGFESAAKVQKINFSGTTPTVTDVITNSYIFNIEFDNTGAMYCQHGYSWGGNIGVKKFTSSGGIWTVDNTFAGDGLAEDMGTALYYDTGENLLYTSYGLKIRRKTLAGATSGTDITMPSAIKDITSIATDNTYVYIVDYIAHKVWAMKKSDQTFREIGNTGSLDGQVVYPAGGTNINGNLLVADTGNNRIQSFTYNGAYVTKAGIDGTGIGNMKSPSGVAFDGTNIFIVDAGNSRILKYDSSYNYVTKWGDFGTSAGQLSGAFGIAVDSNYVYVSETGNNRIQVFTKNGVYVTSWTGYNQPKGIFAYQNYLYVAEYGSGSIIKIDKTTVTSPQTIWTKVGFTQSYGVTVTTGNVFVLDTGANSVKKLDELGNLVKTWTGFNAPQGIVADQWGNIYVSDSGNNSIKKIVVAPTAVGNVGKVIVTGAAEGATVKLYNSSNAVVLSGTVQSGKTIYQFLGVPQGIGYYVTQTIGTLESELSDTVAVVDSIIAQDGFGFSGTTEFDNFSDNLQYRNFTNWPIGIIKGTNAFKGGISDGTYGWLVPHDSNMLVKINMSTGVTTGYDMSAAGLTATNSSKFSGGVYDGTYLWLIPDSADRVVKVDVSNGSMTNYTSFPGGFDGGTSKFRGGVYDGTYIWMVPYDANMVVKVGTSDGTMTGYNSWPGTFSKGSAAFSGGVYDGSYLWLVPYNADRVLKVNAAGTISEVPVANWPVGFVKGNAAFSGGTFDGTNMWLAPYDADRIIKVNTSTSAITGYTAWPTGDGFVKGSGDFEGAIYDGQSVVLIPSAADRPIKVDKSNGTMTGLAEWSTDLNKGSRTYSGGFYDGTALWLVPYTSADRLTSVIDDSVTVAGSTRAILVTGGVRGGIYKIYDKNGALVDSYTLGTTEIKHTFTDVLADTGYKASQVVDGIEGTSSSAVNVKPTILSLTGGTNQITITGVEVGATITLYDSGNNSVALTPVISETTATFSNVPAGIGYYAKQTVNTVTGDSSSTVSVKPAIPSFSAVLMGDNGINNAEKAVFIVSGTADAGARIYFSVNDTDGNTSAITASGIATGGVFSISLNVTTLSDGTLTVTVYAELPTGVLGDSATKQVTKDIVASTISITSSTNATTGVTPIPVTITFSEDVTGFDVGDITVSSGTKSSFTPVSASVYTINITPTADGAVTIDIATGAAIDTYGNSNTAATRFSRTFDGTGPIVTITSSALTSTNISPILVTVTFNEAATGFVLSDMTVVNGNAQNFTSVSATTYTAEIVPMGDGTVTVSLATGVAIDAYGNLNSQSNILTRTYDTQAPTVSIFSSASSYTNLLPIPITITFSESVTGFAIGDITPGNATLGNFTGTGTIYTVNVTPSGIGVVTVDISGARCQDIAGNNNTASAQFARNYDNSNPTVIISSTATNPTGTSPIPVTITFNKSVTGFDVTDIVVANGTKSGFSGSGTTYTFDVIPNPLSTITVDVSAGVATDAWGNTNNVAVQLSRGYNSTKPSASVTSAVGTATNISPIPVTVTFSEGVSGFDVSGVTVTNGTKSNFAGGPSVYTLDVTPSTQGNVSVFVLEGPATAVNPPNNTNATSSTLVVNYDITQPTVSITTSALAVTNSAIPVTITFSEAVTGFVVGDISAPNCTINSFSGSGANYTAIITPTTDCTVTVNINLGVCQDSAGNNNLALATPLVSVYDITPPNVVISSTATTYTNSSSIPVTIAFDSAVTGFLVGDISVSNGTKGTLTTSDNQTYSINIIPIAEGPVTINVGAGVCQDDAGNANTAAIVYTRTYDATAPTVSVSSAVAGTVNTTIPVTIDFSEDVTGFTVGDISVSNGTAGSFVQINQRSYTAVITATTAGTVTVNVAGGVCADIAVNSNSVATTLSRVYDNIQPTVVITSVTNSETNASPIPVTITFSEEVSNFDIADIIASGATLGNFGTVSSSVYTIQVTPSVNGNVTLDIGAGIATDTAGNSNTAATQFLRTYDSVRPSVTITSSALNPGNVSPIPVTITFSEAVTNFDVSDVTVTNGTKTGFAAHSNSVYTLNVVPTQDGFVTIDIHAYTAQDLAGNGNTEAVQKNLMYDATGPMVTITTILSSSTTSSIIPVEITFDEPVTGFDVSDITVTNGTKSNFTGSGTNYTLDVTAVTEGAITIGVAGNLVCDSALNGNTTASTLVVNYDISCPTVVLTSLLSGTITQSQIPITATFNESVVGLTSGGIVVTNGTVSGLSGSGTIFTFNIEAVSAGTISVQISNGAGEDLTTNENIESNILSFIYQMSRGHSGSSNSDENNKEKESEKKDSVDENKTAVNDEEKAIITSVDTKNFSSDDFHIKSNDFSIDIASKDILTNIKSWEVAEVKAIIKKTYTKKLIESNFPSVKIYGDSILASVEMKMGSQLVSLVKTDNLVNIKLNASILNMDNVKNPRNLVVARVEKDGKLTILGGASDGKSIAFKTKEFGTFVVIENKVVLRDIEKTYFKDEIEVLAARSIISEVGSKIQKFEPKKEITRGEFAKFIARSVNIQPVEYTGKFRDIKSNDVNAGYIQAMYDNKLISGYGNTFGPNDKLTREQLTKLTVDIFKFVAGRTGSGVSITKEFKDINNVSSYAKDKIQEAMQLGLIKGYPDGTFKPKELMTKQDSVGIIYRLMKSTKMF